MLTLLTPKKKSVSHEHSRSSERVNRPNTEELNRHYSQIIRINSTLIAIKDTGVDEKSDSGSPKCCDQTGWETAERGMVSRLCALFKAYTGRRAWEAIVGRLLRPCYLSREHHNRKIRSRKQRTDIGKYSFVDKTFINWNQLPADLLASFSCKLNTFRKRVKKVLTNK
jgi:hypothetical protein